MTLLAGTRGGEEAPHTLLVQEECGTHSPGHVTSDASVAAQAGPLGD